MNEHINLLGTDLETYGLTTDAIILQIAVAFVDRNGEIHSFSTPCSLDSQPNRREDKETVAWWNKQKQEVRDQVITPALHPDCPSLRDALIALTGWICSEAKGAPLWPWGNGASFDIGMLNHAYAQEGLKPPWNYRHERDQRTLEALAAIAGIDLRWQADERTGSHHEAESDAIYQARRIHRIWNEITSLLRMHGTQTP